MKRFKQPQILKRTVSEDTFEFKSGETRPESQVVRLSSGEVRLRFRGDIFTRYGFDDFGQICPGREWYRRYRDEDHFKYRTVPKKHWKVLNEKVRQVELTGVPADEAASAGPSPSQKHRTKYGIRIFSSDGKHFFDIGCWPSRKYEGRFSIRLGIMGKRGLYTIRYVDLEAMIAELQRSKPAQPANPP